MKLVENMVFLGAEERESKKNAGSFYHLVRLMDSGGMIYEFFVSMEKVAVTTRIKELTQLTPVAVELKISSYQMKAQIDLENVMTAAEVKAGKK